MKKEIIGILVCMILIFVAVAPVVNALNNKINEVTESNRIVDNNVKLNPPQPAEWPPYNEIIDSGFGRISNPKRVSGDCSYYWSFNCENVIGHIYDYENEYDYWDHFTNNEVRYIIGDPCIITDHFMIGPLIPHFHFYLIVD